MSVDDTFRVSLENAILAAPSMGESGDVIQANLCAIYATSIGELPSHLPQPSPKPRNSVYGA